ncbi:MAG: DUF1887 family protein, partial [Anaerolineae bacterium]|nr:DUF1887 family protein [Anaerolineae bacterium]
LLHTELGIPPNAHGIDLNPSTMHYWPFATPDPQLLCRWLDGTWLEHYVLSQVTEVAQRCQLHDWGMTLRTDSGSTNPDFEFDVVALRGYQLFGISCTTSTDKHRAKLKLFEAYVRARQLGGEEARVGLVAGYAKPKGLQKEVENQLDVDGKVQVFGPRDLPTLARDLIQWFQKAG